MAFVTEADEVRVCQPVHVVPSRRSANLAERPKSGWGPLAVACRGWEERSAGRRWADPAARDAKPARRDEPERAPGRRSRACG